MSRDFDRHGRITSSKDTHITGLFRRSTTMLWITFGLILCSGVSSEQPQRAMCDGVEDAEWCPEAAEFCDWPQVYLGCPGTCDTCPTTSSTSSTTTRTFSTITATTPTTSTKTSITNTATTITSTSATTTTITTLTATTNTATSFTVTSPTATSLTAAQTSSTTSSTKMLLSTVSSVGTDDIDEGETPTIKLCDVSPDPPFCDNVLHFCADSEHVQDTCPRTCALCIETPTTQLTPSPTFVLTPSPSSVPTSPPTMTPTPIQHGSTYKCNGEMDFDWCVSIIEFCNVDAQLTASCPVTCGKCDSVETAAPSTAVASAAASLTALPTVSSTLSSPSSSSSSVQLTSPSRVSTASLVATPVTLSSKTCNGVSDPVWCASASMHCLTSNTVASACRATCDTCINNPIPTTTLRSKAIISPTPMIGCNGVGDPKWCQTIQMFCSIDYGLTSSCPATCDRCPTQQPQQNNNNQHVGTASNPDSSNPLHLFLPQSTTPVPVAAADTRSGSRINETASSASTSADSNLPTVLIGSMVVLVMIFFGVVIYHCLHQKPSRKLDQEELVWQMARSPTMQVGFTPHGYPMVFSPSTGANGMASPQAVTSLSPYMSTRPLPQVPPGTAHMKNDVHGQVASPRPSTTFKFDDLESKESQLHAQSVTHTSTDDGHNTVFTVPDNKLAQLRQTLTEGEDNQAGDEMIYERAASCYLLAMPDSRLGEKKESSGLYETVSHVKIVPQDDALYDTAAPTAPLYRGRNDHSTTSHNKFDPDEMQQDESGIYDSTTLNEWDQAPREVDGEYLDESDMEEVDDDGTDNEDEDEDDEESDGIC